MLLYFLPPLEKNTLELSLPGSLPRLLVGIICVRDQRPFVKYFLWF